MLQLGSIFGLVAQSATEKEGKHILVSAQTLSKPHD